MMPRAAIVVRVVGSGRSEYVVDAASADEALAVALRLELDALAKEREDCASASVLRPARAPLRWRMRRPSRRPRAERVDPR